MVPPRFNTAVFYPAKGLARGYAMVERGGEGIKHLRVSAVYSTKDKALSLAHEQRIRQLPVRASDRPGVQIDGGTGKASPL